MSETSGVGLCMSGGGYRAMLFHVGALWRLNELGYLSRLTRVSSVSGGSITSGRLGLVWGKLDFRGGIARAFEPEVVAPLRRLASHTIDLPAVLVGSVLPFISIADRIESAYQKYLFDDATVADLPAGPGAPTFVINAASVQTGSLFRFEQGYVADWRVGINRKAPAQIKLATAVAASSAFAPFLSPVVIDFDPADFEDTEGADLGLPDFRKRAVLTDGGNYDNLGLQTLERCETVLVSDAVGALPPDEAPHKDWVRHGIRAIEMLLNQTVSLRKRRLLDELTSKQRTGTYWSVRSQIADYHLANPIVFDQERGDIVAQTPTRLEALHEDVQNGLINWGYVICDTAIRRWLEPQAALPAKLPY